MNCQGESMKEPNFLRQFYLLHCPIIIIATSEDCGVGVH